MTMIKTLRMFLGTLAAAALVALVGPAQGKVVGSSFDPTFFDGTGFFFIPDSPSPCLTLSDGFHAVNPGSEGCSGVVLLNASVNVNDTINTAHLFLPPPTPAGDAVTGIVLDSAVDPVLVGVDTAGQFSPSLIQLSIDTCTGSFCSDNWFIQWVSGLQPSPFDESFLAFDGIPGLSNAVILYNQSCSVDGEFEFCGDIVPFGDPATNVRFFNPEPGSLALLLGALGIGWFARRRKVAQ
jgi:hypothetical protein